MTVDISSLQTGTKLPEMTRKVLQERINEYAEASGDFNPIHIDPEFARGTVMGSTIAHGMLVLAYVSDYMAGLFGIDWITDGQLGCRFKDPARPGDTLTIGGTISKLETFDDATVVSAEVTVLNQDGQTILACETNVKVNRK
jgi:3-hydroxybutyryl-CoA dehydratase